MIVHAWTLVCAKSIVDPETNNMTLTEVMEQVNIEGEVQFPTVAPLQMDLVSVWYRSNADQGTLGSGRFLFLNPNGEAVGKSGEFAIDLTKFFRSRTIARFAGLPLVGPGIYFFKVELRIDADHWREVAKVPINVLLAPAAVVINAPPQG